MLDAGTARLRAPAGALVSGVDRIRELTGLCAGELLALEGFDERTSDAVVYLSGSLVSGHANP